MKQIKNAPMKQNLADIFKSALYLVASTLAFAIKLTIAIIKAIVASVKTFAQAVTN